MGDMFDGLARSGCEELRIHGPAEAERPQPGTSASEPITSDACMPVTDFLKPNGPDRHRDRKLDVRASRRSRCPTGRRSTARCLWGAIGWATGATLGIALADRSRRTVLFTGEGSHQLTMAEVGTMARYGLKPVIFVLNNDGYMVERALEKNSNPVYDDDRALEVSGPAGRPRLRRMVHDEGDDARRARRGARPGEPRPARPATSKSSGEESDLPAGLASVGKRLGALYANS